MDTCFSTGAIAVVTPLLIALTGAIGVLFRELLRAKDAQIEELTRLAERGTDVMERAVSVVERRGERR